MIIPPAHSVSGVINGRPTAGPGRCSAARCLALGSAERDAGGGSNGCPQLGQKAEVFRTGAPHLSQTWSVGSGGAAAAFAIRTTVRHSG